MQIQLNDDERVLKLHSYGILDTTPDEIFDQLTKLAATALDIPISLVTLVDRDRQWFKSRVGLDVTETSRDVAFCDHAIRQDTPLIVNDAREDPRFADNPLVTGEIGIRFYAGVPLFSPEGYGLGTLCVIDHTPRDLNRREVEILTHLARITGTAIELHKKSKTLQQTLEALSGQKKMRETLASMVVHDMRGPLTAILGLASVLLLKETGFTASSLKDICLAAERLERMAANVLDICLSETGALKAKLCLTDIGNLIEEQIKLFRLMAERKGVRVDWQPVNKVVAEIDPELIGRVLGNLLDNGIEHSPQGTAIKISLLENIDTFEIEVADSGTGIPQSEWEQIFDVGFQSAEAYHRRGHGLGLAFCRLALDKHRGEIRVADNGDGGARFVMRLPKSS